MSPLGYVFWHWPRRGFEGPAYERRLSAFQEALRAHPPRGLVDALSFREGSPPWSARPRTTYEDWYLVEDYASLGYLNEAAVSGPSREPHDEVAGEALGGAGGLYVRRRGGLSLKDSRFATWASKPPGAEYGAFFEAVYAAADEDEADVWQRQLVLGPAPEFCIHGRSPVRLPKSFRPVTMEIRPVERGRR